jgi:hypothetical protein
VSSLSGLRLAVSALVTVALTWAAYNARRPESLTLYRGAMVGAATLAVLALFNSPGMAGALVAVVAFIGAARFPRGGNE